MAAVPVIGSLHDLADGVIALRPWAPEDASFLQEASADAAIQRYSLSRSQPFALDEAREQLQGNASYRLTADALGRPFGSLVIADAVTELALGQCGSERLERLALRTDELRGCGRRLEAATLAE